MQKVNIQPTEKLYYQNMLLSSCSAIIIGIGENFVVTDRTISFPEGGGQEGDRGEIILSNEEKIGFIDTKKRYGTPVYLDDFPTINVDTQICHYIKEEDQEKLSELFIGDSVIIKIDITRREKLTISHTASHLLYLGIAHFRPEAVDNVIGCHIKEEGARFDFSITDKFDQDLVQNVALFANKMAKKDLPIKLYPHEKNPDAWFWECDNKKIPCGGTHLQTTGNVRNLIVKRKNIGKGKDRIMCVFPDAQIDLSKYE